MKPQIYFFGTLPGGFSSYPGDHTRAFFEDFLKRSKNQVQIVVHRDGNLLHYGYVRQFLGNNYFGICLCVDCIFKDVHYLFDAFDDVYTSLIKQGAVIKIGKSGITEWATKTFVSESVALREHTLELIKIISFSEDTTLPLPPADFSISINDCLDLSLDTSNNTSINTAIGRYSNVYIVKSNVEIERLTSYANVLRGKDKEIENLKNEIVQCKEQYQKILRQKKQYRFVALLSLVLIGLGVGLFFLNNNLNATKRDLADANYTIEIRDDSLTSKQNQISQLNTNIYILKSDLSTERERRKDVEEELSSFKDMIIGIQPLIVKSTSFSFSTGWLSFDYYGLQETTVELKVHAYGEYEYSNSKSMDVELGDNSSSIYVGSGLNSSKWYTFELMVGNKIVGGDRH